MSREPRGSSRRQSKTDVEIEFSPEIFGASEDGLCGFAGRVCVAPEMRYTQKGVAVTNLRLAYQVTDREHGFEKIGVTFFNVVIWRDQAERVGDTISVGDTVTGIGFVEWVEGSEEKYDGFKITAEHVGPSMLWSAVEIKSEEPHPKPSRAKARTRKESRGGYSTQARTVTDEDSSEDDTEEVTEDTPPTSKGSSSRRTGTTATTRGGTTRSKSS